MFSVLPTRSLNRHRLKIAACITFFLCKQSQLTDAALHFSVLTPSKDPAFVSAEGGLANDANLMSGFLIRSDS